MGEGRGKDESPFKNLPKASNQQLYHHFTLTATLEAKFHVKDKKKKNHCPWEGILYLGPFTNTKTETHLATSQ